MRRRSRLGMVVLVALCLLALALLLRGLVETPAQSQADEPQPMAAAAQFLPAPPPNNETPTDARGLWAAFTLALLCPVCAAALPLRVSGVDANGRVLRRRRYARCFYPVFRQELACG